MTTSKKLTEEFVNSMIDVIALLKEKAKRLPDQRELIEDTITALEKRTAELVQEREATDL